MRSKYPSNNESGFVTVLMVLLIGMAIAASAVGTAYYVNSAQKGLVSGHALTNAKSGAWTGVETFRQYLEGLNAAQINELNGKTGITLTAGSRTLKVKSLSVDTLGTTNPTYRVTAEIQNSSDAAKSSATVQVVYDVTLATSPSGGSTPTTVTIGGAMNFYGNLRVGGNITFANGPQDTVLNVAGTFDSTSGASGLDYINAGGFSKNFKENKFDSTEINLITSMQSKPIVNALDFEDDANYVFYVDTTGAIKVDVKHVTDIPDDTYDLGQVGGGFSSSVLDYEIDSDGDVTWILKNSPIARGVLLFKGSVDISGKGDFVNTILATGDIDYGNPNVSLTASNRASADLVCKSIAFNMPTNLCNEDKTLKTNTIGDIALLAGSCTNTTSVPNCSSTYTGGNIDLGANSNVKGSIVAGNKIYARGKTNIGGPILAAALLKTTDEDKKESDLGAKFTIDFGGTDRTITLPVSGGGTGGGSGTTTQTSQIKWARYI